MRAVVVEQGRLRLRADLPSPVPGPRELRIDVRAAGVNHVDLLRKAAHFEGTGGGPSIAGIEAAGVVGAIGADVTRFAVGERVMAMVAGGYAEQVCVDERLCVGVPDSLDWDAAAATTVSFMTAHDALFTQGRVQAGDTVLVLGCTTSAGIAAVQLARRVGATVVGTSTSRDKLDAMRERGVDVGVLAGGEGETAAATLQASDGRGAAVIVDMVGASAAADALAAAAIGARWISVGRVGGKEARIDLAEFARKRVRLIGVTFRTRSLDERAAIVDAFVRDVRPGLATGDVGPRVDRVFALDEAEAAQDHVASRRAFGKVVLRVS